MSNQTLEEMASIRKIKIHESFAEFLQSSTEMHSFDISLLDCYRAAGHACHAITGAFLVTEAAIENLYPENKICERGDLSIEFGSNLDESATGPRSNIISYITGAWDESGFPGLRGNFIRKNLVSYGVAELEKKSIRFKRISNGQSVVVNYDPSHFVSELNLQFNFPEIWRAEINAILKNSTKVINISKS